MDTSERRAHRLAAYEKLLADRPHLFSNPDDAPFRILLDAKSQNDVADASAEMARAQGLPEEFGDIGVIYQDRYVTVVRDAVLFPSGVPGAYVRVCPSSDGVGAAILPVLSDGRIVLVRHFRHADRQWHWEVPRGFGEPGEQGDVTARREAEEELGCPARELIHLGAMEADTGMAAPVPSCTWPVSMRTSSGSPRPKAPRPRESARSGRSDRKSLSRCSWTVGSPTRSRSRPSPTPGPAATCDHRSGARRRIPAMRSRDGPSRRGTLSGRWRRIYAAVAPQAAAGRPKGTAWDG